VPLAHAQLTAAAFEGMVDRGDGAALDKLRERARARASTFSDESFAQQFGAAFHRIV
jgi:hypothetical protein